MAQLLLSSIPLRNPSIAASARRCDGVASQIERREVLGAQIKGGAAGRGCSQLQRSSEREGAMAAAVVVAQQHAFPTA
nr:unnamed protein product [Digitaria exilis]